MGIRIKKNDTVEVISGRERGKRGHVLRVLSSGEHAHVLIEKLNMIKKHMKPSAKNKEGGILEMEGPIQMSNVSVVCPKCEEVAKLGFKVSGDDNKARYCKQCQEIID